MEDFKKIVVKILGLIVDIFLLSISILKHIVLPGKSRKGNVLSSILIFFISFIERLHLFEHGFFKMTSVFRQKYVRRIVILIAGILFILASFECSVQTQNNSIDRGAAVEFLSTITPTKTATHFQFNILSHPACRYILVKQSTCTNTDFISPLKKYLLTHSLLI